jgi:hypothetical protein
MMVGAFIDFSATGIIFVFLLPRLGEFVDWKALFCCETRKLDLPRTAVFVPPRSRAPTRAHEGEDREEKTKTAENSEHNESRTQPELESPSSHVKVENLYLWSERNSTGATTAPYHHHHPSSKGGGPGTNTTPATVRRDGDRDHQKTVNSPTTGSGGWSEEGELTTTPDQTPQLSPQQSPRSDIEIILLSENNNSSTSSSSSSSSSSNNIPNPPESPGSPVPESVGIAVTESALESPSVQKSDVMFRSHEAEEKKQQQHQ